MAKYNPKYVLDLRKILSNAYEDESLKNKLRRDIATPEFKRLYGQRVVDEIVTRTQNHKDKDSDTLGTYSKAYRESQIFQIYKQGETKVNLTLRGDMLNSIVHDADSKYKIIVNLLEDQRDKARGHITGILGKNGRAKPRDFLGLPSNIEEKLFKDTMKDFRNSSISTQIEEDIGVDVSLTEDAEDF